jgi:hypothetical protein
LNSGQRDAGSWMKAVFWFSLEGDRRIQRT